MNKAPWFGYWRAGKSPATLVPLGARSVGRADYPAGWPHPTGHIKWYNFYWITGGKLELLVNGEKMTLEANEVTVMPPDTRITGIPNETAGRYRWLTLDGPRAGAVLADFGMSDFFRLRTNQCPLDLFDQLELSIQENMPGSEYRAGALAYEILSLAAAGAAGIRQREIAEAYLEKCLRLIEAEFTDAGMNVNLLAERLNMDRSVLSRNFARYYGMPPSAYLKRLRMRRALLLLRESNLPVSRIALRCGYTDAAYFSRLFAREFSQSPLQFRRELQG